MCNCFNLCLFKLFKIKNTAKTNEELNEHNNKLEKFGLNAFEHRLLSRVAYFVHKITNDSKAPTDLKALLIPRNTAVNTTMQLRTHRRNQLTHELTTINSRHKNALEQPKYTSKAGSLTFSHFFASFVTNMVVEDIQQRFSFFKNIIFNNINLLFLKFVFFFPKFDLINKNFDYLLKKKDEGKKSLIVYFFQVYFYLNFCTFIYFINKRRQPAPWRMSLDNLVVREIYYLTQKDCSGLVWL